MANLLTIVKLVLALLPLLLDAVKAIEAAMPASGAGTLKLAAIRTTLQAAFEAAGEASATFEQVWPALEKATGAAVSLFNATGVFKKG